MQLEQSLTATKLKGWIGRLGNGKVEIRFPKFITSSYIRLDEKL